jgi:hypothetical protein
MEHCARCGELGLSCDECGGDCCHCYSVVVEAGHPLASLILHDRERAVVCLECAPPEPE